MHQRPAECLAHCSTQTEEVQAQCSLESCGGVTLEGVPVIRMATIAEPSREAQSDAGAARNADEMRDSKPSEGDLSNETVEMREQQYADNPPVVQETLVKRWLVWSFSIGAAHFDPNIENWKFVDPDRVERDTETAHALLSCVRQRTDYIAWSALQFEQFHKSGYRAVFSG